VALTTNGQALTELAAPLREAGVRRFNISLDTLDPARLLASPAGPPRWSGSPRHRAAGASGAAS